MIIARAQINAIEINNLIIPLWLNGSVDLFNASICS